MDSAFGDWLAGFFAGEGCFYIYRVRTKAVDYYYCAAAIVLRADDLPILEEIRAKTGIGSLSTVSRPCAAPQCRWVVRRTADCLRLREILRAHPLRAKKARDFDVWSEALEAQVRYSWGQVAKLKEELERGRQWVDDDDQWAFRLEPPDSQLALL